tara:strand:- start:238 stop:591 length:354 start_codon:yes stop_codon:yes gene_type:complete
MGKKRRILAKQRKFSHKHSNHPRLRLTTRVTPPTEEPPILPPTTKAPGITVKEIDTTITETAAVETTIDTPTTETVTKKPRLKTKTTSAPKPTKKTTKKTTTRRRKTTKKKADTVAT